MTREQAKELMPIMQAFAEGKTIQFLVLTETEECWKDLQCDKDIKFNCHFSRYRIKPELKYRPFKNAEECWQEMLKHQPFGWLKCSENNRFVISAIRNEGVCINGGQYCSYYVSVFDKYKFADGTPFGIMEN